MDILQSNKKENCKVEILVEVSPAEYDEAAGKAFIKNRNKVSVPGFRRGKAPRRIVERMYGAEIFLSDTLETLFPNILKTITEDHDYKLIDQPQITDVDLKDEDGSLSVTVAFSIYPEVTLGEYKGLSAPKKSAEVPESDIDTEIATIRMRNSRIESVDRPAQEGDIAVIDFEGFMDGVPFDGGKGDDYELELGSNVFIPGFEDRVCGMEVGEERDIDLAFPDEYEEGLAGKPVVFKVRLNEVKEKQLPDLDDEFAMDVSEFDTLAEYKADVRYRLEKAKKQEVDDAYEQALMEKLLENVEADVPDVMVESRLEGVMKKLARQVSAYNMEPAQYLQMIGMTPETFRENSRASCAKQVKIALALEKIAELENIEISEGEIEKEYDAIAAESGKSIEELRKSLDREDLINDLKLRAAAKLVMDNATAEDPDATDANDDSEAKKPASKKPAQKKSAQKQSADATEQASAGNDPADEELADADAKVPAKKTRAKKSEQGDKE